MKALQFIFIHIGRKSDKKLTEWTERTRCFNHLVNDYDYQGNEFHSLSALQNLRCVARSFH